MLWPTVVLVSWFAMAGLVIGLGRGSTSRYELERNRVQQVAVAVPAAPGGAFAGRPVHEAAEEAAQAQGPAVATAVHPAGDAAAAWWLVDDMEGDEWLGRAVAGPFADRFDAELAALVDGHPGSTRPVHGVPRAEGAVLLRQTPEERVWFAELGGHLQGLPEEWDDRLTDDDALATLVVEIGAALVEAGLRLHDGSAGATDGTGPVGGVCLMPDPGSDGVLVSWRQHDRMDLLHVRGTAAAVAVRRTMNSAVADVLTHLGLAVEPMGPWGCCRVRSGARD